MINNFVARFGVETTFVELTGATYPQQIGDRAIDPLMGKSLLPIFRGENDPILFGIHSTPPTRHFDCVQ